MMGEEMQVTMRLADLSNLPEMPEVPMFYEVWGW